MGICQTESVKLGLEGANPVESFVNLQQIQSMYLSSTGFAGPRRMKTWQGR